MRNRILSLLLALAMLLPLVPVIPQKAEAATSFAPIWPVQHGHIASGLDYYSGGGPHGGIDINPDSYDDYRYQDIYAIAAGKVIEVRKAECQHESLLAEKIEHNSALGCTDGWGNYVCIEHTVNGTKYYSIYAHLKYNSATVSDGQTVSAGTKIGQMGSSGDSTGHHLHLEIWSGVRDNSDRNAKKAYSFDYYRDNPSSLIGIKFKKGLATYSQRYKSWITSNCTLSGDYYYYNGTPDLDYLDFGADFYAHIYHPESGWGLCNVDGNVQLGEYSTTSSLWRFVRQSDGSYVLYSSVDNNVMDVYNNDTANKTNIQTYPYNDTSAQKWFIIANGSGYSLVSASSYKSVDITGAATSCGSNAAIYDRNDHGSQIFQIYQVSSPGFTVSTRNINLNVDGTNSQTIDIQQYGSFTGGSTIYWDSPTLNVSWGSWDNGKIPITLSANNTDDTYLRISLYYSDSGELISEQNYFPTVTSSSSASSYTVSYSANGGSGAPASQTKYHGNTLTLSSVTPVREGYAFLGWATSSSATAAQYSPGSGYSKNSPVTLYAVWQSNATALTVNSNNNAVISNAGDTKEFTYTPTKSGKYVIYSTGSDDTRVYLYDASGALLSSDDDGGDNHNFRLEYNLTAGVTYTYGVKYYSAFETGTIEFAFGRVATISYDANGGSGAPAAQYKDYGKDLTITSVVPTRTGYIFGGWGLYASDTDPFYFPGGTCVLQSDWKFYAIWRESLAASNSAVISEAGEKKYYAYTPATSGIYSVCSTGSDDTRVYLYEYTGSQLLASDDDGGDNRNFRLEYDLNAGTTYLFAVKFYDDTKTGTINFNFGEVYTINYSANGGTDAPASQSKDQGQTITLSSAVPTRSGYIFLGWATSATATSASYQPGASYTRDSSTTLYAVWEEATLTGITVKNQPTKTEYWVGESLDTTGLTLTATYSDGSTETVTTGFAVTGFNSTSAGTKTVTVTYEGNTTAFNVTVKQLTVTGITVKTQPSKTEYWIGESLDITGLTLTATYSDGSTETVTEGFTVTGFNSTSAGTKTVTVTYEGKTTAFNVTVKQLTVTGITVKTQPSKTEYWIGESLDITGLTLTATYSDGSTETVTEGLTVSGFSSTSAGTKKVTVSYKGESTIFPVTVVYGGYCGEDLIWTLNSAGKLTISGTGAMSDFSYSEDASAPWLVYRTKILSVEVCSGVTTLGNYAFYKCSKIEQVSLPAGLSTIGNCAFSQCSSLSAAQLPNSVTAIGWNAFYQCTSLEAVNIPSGVTVINRSTFCGCYKLEEITIPEGVTSIGNSAFNLCIKLKEITIPDSVTSIGQTVFGQCNSLTTVTIPASVTEIDVAPFYACGNLTEIIVEEENQYFCNDEHGALLSKDETVFYQLPGAYTGTYSAPESVKQIKIYAFRGCQGLTGVTLPDSVTEIGHSAFYDCSALTSITIPAGMSGIRYKMFTNCTNLASVTLPKGITQIDNDVFSNCVSLADVYYGGTQEQWDAISINETGNDCLTAATLHVTPITLTGIAVATQPTKTEYWVGESLDITDLALTATYSDGSTETVTEGFAVSGFSSTAAGTKTVTVTYEGKTTSFTVTVSQPAVTGITVKTQPAKTEYWVGESLDATGLTLNATYSDGSTKIVTEGFTVSGFSSTSAGRKTVTVTYEGKTATFTVEVKQPTVTGITVKTQPAKTEYWVGESLDTTGLTLNATYSDGSTETVTNGFTVSGFSSTSAGTKTVTVTYEGKTATFTVTVKQPTVTGIIVKTQPTKTEYWVGESLDTTGLTLTATYSDGSTETVTDGFTVSGFSSTTAGSKTITVTYEGKSATFAITVEEIIDETAPIIVVGKTRGKAGNTVSVAISLKNNPGIASAKLKVLYDDSVMQLVEVTDSGALGTQVHKPELINPYSLNWANDTATTNFDFSGTIVVLTFKISDNADYGKYPISVSYDYDNFDIINCNMMRVKFAVDQGYIEVADVILGDVNSDGAVNTLDRVYLTRYLAEWDGYTSENVDLTAADVNLDGTVNSIDRMILARHLAGWDGYETLPYAG